MLPLGLYATIFRLVIAGNEGGGQVQYMGANSSAISSPARECVPVLLVGDLLFIPEIINGRLAMLAMPLAVFLESKTAKPVGVLVVEAGVSIVVLAAVVSCATLVPITNGVRYEGAGGCLLRLVCLEISCARYLDLPSRCQLLQ